MVKAKDFHDSLDLAMTRFYVICDRIIQELNRGLKQSEKIDGTSPQMLLIILGNLTNLMKLINDFNKIYQELITKERPNLKLTEIKPIIQNILMKTRVVK